MFKQMALAAALVFGAASGANATTTIVNGSFEEGPDPGASPGFVTLATGDTSINGWTVSDGTIDYIGSYWTAEDGNRSVDLAGTSLGTLSQEVADTVLGQLYTITFWASKNPDGGSDIRTGTVSFGGVLLPFEYSMSNDRTNMNWVEYSFSFVGTGPSTTLSFAADPSAGCCYGPAIDNVSISAVPEPSTWAMLLLGFGAVGFGLRRRKAALAPAQLA